MLKMIALAHPPPGVTRGAVRDLDIRRALLSRVKSQHETEPDTRVVEELGICQGASRVDVVVVNGTIHGYEIKSEKDTLYRLQNQRDMYSRALDFVTIVASPTHLQDIRELVPSWWGIWSACTSRSGLKLRVIRKERRNPTVDPLSIAQLLWREEALEVLAEYGIVEGVRSKSRNVLWSKLVESVPLNELRYAVRAKLKARQGWRADEQP